MKHHWCYMTCNVSTTASKDAALAVTGKTSKTSAKRPSTHNVLQEWVEVLVAWSGEIKGQLYHISLILPNLTFTEIVQPH